jgi:hypothetical protein
MRPPAKTLLYRKCGIRKEEDLTKGCQIQFFDLGHLRSRTPSKSAHTSNLRCERIWGSRSPIDSPKCAQRKYLCEMSKRDWPRVPSVGGPPSPRFAGRGQQAFVFLIRVFIPVSYQLAEQPLINLQNHREGLLERRLLLSNESAAFSGAGRLARCWPGEKPGVA